MGSGRRPGDGSATEQAIGPGPAAPGRAAALVVACALVAAAAPAPARAETWARMGAAQEFARARRGSVSIAFVGERGKLHGYRARRVRPSASVVKAMFLAAYLRRASVRDRRLRDRDRALLGPMIRRSDDAAATAVADIVGAAAMRRLARRARMRDFHYTRPWGRTGVTAADQARLFHRYDDFVPRRHRAYARRLLSHVVESQRWGIARVRLHGWKLFFKGGWGSGTGAVDHQVAFLEDDGERVAVAILTEASPSHRYGKRTLRGVAARLLRDLP